LRVLIRVCGHTIVLIGPVKHPVLVYFSLGYFFTVFVLFTSYVILILTCVNASDLQPTHGVVCAGIWSSRNCSVFSTNTKILEIYILPRGTIQPNF
jgi:hypothetical protein